MNDNFRHFALHDLEHEINKDNSGKMETIILGQKIVFKQHLCRPTD